MRGFLGQSRRICALAAGLALCLTSACAAPTSYMGISLAPGGAPAEIQALAARARGGDKQAQLDLGILYEEARAIPRDLDRARRLYRMAATATGGTFWVYQPPVTRDGAGSVVPIDRGRRSDGLPEARQRLERLEK